MTLRARLSLAFILVVLVPVAVGAVLVGRGVPGAVRNQVGNRVQAAVSGAAVDLSQTCARARLAAEILAREAAAGAPGAAARDVVGRRLAGYAATSTAAGQISAAAGVPPASSVVASGAGCLWAARASAVDVTSRVRLLSGRAAAAVWAVVAVPVTAGTLAAVTAGTGTDATLASGGRALLSTMPARDAQRLVHAARRVRPGGGRTSAGSWLVTAASVAPGLAVLVSAPAPSAGGLEALLALVIVAALALAALIGRQLSEVTTRPLAELSDAAARVAAGDLDTQIGVRSRDEVGRLATAFNDMTDHLRSYIGALESSRDELRRSITRLGETLSNTHDMNRILEVIVETAMASVGARAGAIMLSAAGRGDLYLKVERGLLERGVDPGLRVPLGKGVIGRVAATGLPLHGRTGDPGIHPVAAEPRSDSLIGVPLKIGGKVTGVLALYDREGGTPFSEEDVDTVRSFTSQSAVAIDNVLLHQEAQRLSITDGLTGLWNYRYFQMNFGKEIERSARFGRPLAVLMLDLDRFKLVNDTYGHQRGDSVLVELATRVKSQIREVDTLARYGGEEFVLVLPETDPEGARLTAERICAVVREQPFGTGDEEPLRVSVSVGVAVFPSNANTGPTLLRAADEALYAAKSGGRDRCVVSTAASDAPGGAGQRRAGRDDAPAAVVPPAPRARR